MKSAEREVETGLGCKIQTPEKKLKILQLKIFRLYFNLSRVIFQTNHARQHSQGGQRKRQKPRNVDPKISMKIVLHFPPIFHRS